MASEIIPSSKREEWLKKIKTLIPDENLRKLIFNFENERSRFLKVDYSCIKYFSNLLVVTYFIIYEYFLQWKKKYEKESITSDKEYTNSRMRIYNMFSDCYKGQKLSYYIIQDLITNIEIDNAFNTRKEENFLQELKLTKFFNFSNDSQQANELTKHIFSLNKSRLSDRSAEDAFTFADFEEVLALFSFLQFTKVEFVENKEDKILDINIKFVNEKARKELFFDELSLKKLFFVNNNDAKDCYFLKEVIVDDPRKFEVDVDKEQKIKLVYNQILGEGKLNALITNNKADIAINEKIKAENIKLEMQGADINDLPPAYKQVIAYDTAVEDFLIDYNLVDLARQKNQLNFFKNYNFINNRYIKYLALTISDAMSVTTKTAVYEIYKDKYKNIFEKINGSNDVIQAINYNWDEIIILLFFEEGIYELLEVLFTLKSGKIEYDKFLESFSLRFGDVVSQIKESNSFIKNPEERLTCLSDENRVRCQIQALILLAKKIFYDRNINFMEIIPVTIGDIVQKMKSIQNTDRKISDQKKIMRFVHELAKVNEDIHIFYEALLEYAGKQLEGESTENIQGNKSEAEKYLELITKCQKAFEEKVSVCKKEFDNIIQKSYNKIKFNANFIDDVKDFVNQSFEDLLDFNNTITSNKIQKDILIETLGRDKIFDEDKMKKFQIDIINCLSNRKEFSAVFLFDIIAAYFQYIRFGLYDNYLLDGTIYPIIATYSEGGESRDGYKYAYFSTLESKGENEQKLAIKAISDCQFNFEKAYFCIPNRNRTALIRHNREEIGDDEVIWVNPIIIPYSSFKSKFSLSNNTEITHKQGLEPADYDKASQLIYQTDSVYTRLFGSLENARKVLPVLFEDKGSSFYKGYYQVIKYKHMVELDGTDVSKPKKNEGKVVEEVIGIVSVYDKMPCWNPKVLQNAFEQCHLKMPEDMQFAADSMADTYHDEYVNKMFINDLCVDERYRDKGVAKELLKRAIATARSAHKDIILQVFCDNHIALGLYRKMNFEEIRIGQDLRGTKNSPQKYCIMVNYASKK